METSVSDSDKVVVGTVAGAEIPVYEIKSDRGRDAKEVVTLRDGSYRLPFRVKDLPRGARETVTFSSRCDVDPSRSPAVASSVIRAPVPKRVPTAAAAPQPPPAAKKDVSIFGN